ncbi:hypothetical protein FRX31_031762 [Thalictrum thalictroides]|uniref:Uncharacterized protein n=1 Tax=Thalictrum thalictroides TaxID=46969 RepID=A0A7J6V310_THATH|nr:hypothetical protein FRX31_031762 [Thalictrum thalictroides]
MSSTKPDKTISDDAADSPSTSNMPYNPQREVTNCPSLQDEPKCKSLSPILNFDDITFVFSQLKGMPKSVYSSKGLLQGLGPGVVIALCFFTVQRNAKILLSKEIL